MNTRFFAIVGPAGAGKTTLFERLQGLLPRSGCSFLCDSSGANQGAPHEPFIEGITQLARNGLHKCAGPRSQLLTFWSRLVCIIENEVKPSLDRGQTIVMNGFGGTVLAHARSSTTDETVREALLAIHKDMIKHCVVGLGVPPPVYLWLRSSPEVSETRLREQGSTRQYRRDEDVARINSEFEFYGHLPGQTVIQIDANQPQDMVVDEALRIITKMNPSLELMAA